MSFKSGSNKSVINAEHLITEETCKRKYDPDVLIRVLRQLILYLDKLSSADPI